MPEKRIFIACPIGAADSPERARSDKLLKFIIQPAVKEAFGADPASTIIRADQMGEPGSITTQVLRELSTADIVIADLTGPNANVMYELGVRQALLKPYVLMAEQGFKLPFDLYDSRTVFYQLELESVEQGQAELRAHLTKAASGHIPPLEQAIFAAARGNVSAEAAPASDGLLAVLEACQLVLREAQETKNLLLQVGGIVLDLKGTKDAQDKAQQDRVNQETAMWLFSQFVQNPDSVDKVMPVLERFAEMGNQQSATQPQGSPTSSSPERKKQRGNRNGRP